MNTNFHKSIRTEFIPHGISVHPWKFVAQENEINLWFKKMK